MICTSSLVSRSQTLSSIAQHRCCADRGKGLAKRDYKLICPMACVGGYAPAWHPTSVGVGGEEF